MCPATSSTGFPGGTVVKNPPANAGDTGLIPGLGRSLGEGNGKSFQYSCLGNSMDRGIWRVRDHGVAKSQTQVSTHTHYIINYPSLAGLFIDLQTYSSPRLQLTEEEATCCCRYSYLSHHSTLLIPSLL